MSFPGIVGGWHNPDGPGNWVRGFVVMDIYCPRCGEPWDIDSLHEETDYRQESGETVSFNGVRREFSRRGCLALTAYGVSEADCRRDTGNARAMASGALMEILGDDIDGVASLMDDAHAIGMFR